MRKNKERMERTIVEIASVEDGVEETVTIDPDDIYEEVEFYDVQLSREIKTYIDEAIEDFYDAFGDAMYDARLSAVACRWYHRFERGLTDKQRAKLEDECLEVGVDFDDVIDELYSLIEDEN